MKFVKKSISLPEDLFRFAEKRAAQVAKERSDRTNISSYVRDLLNQERNKQREPEKQAA